MQTQRKKQVEPLLVDVMRGDSRAQNFEPNDIRLQQEDE